MRDAKPRWAEGLSLKLLANATKSHDVVMLFCRLASAELRIQRVRLRVANGGHDIEALNATPEWARPIVQADIEFEAGA